MMRFQRYISVGVLAICFALASTGQAQDSGDAKPADAQGSAPAAAPAAPSPLPTPAITGPLSGLPPATFEAGRLGKFEVNGILNGMGMWTGNPISGDNDTHAALSNGQVFIQKTDGVVQFYLQAGAYNLPALATPFLDTDKTITNLYGPVPVAFLKLQAGKTTQFLIGALPTLIGAEYTFTFENMNVERGLLWNQENAINRGIQVNQTLGKYLTLSASWNDGFYSNRYNWITGSLTFTKGASALAFVGGGNAGTTVYGSAATPVLQNNSRIYNVIYTFTKAGWIIQPYYQYTDVPVNAKISVTKATSTNGGALLISKSLKHGFSMAGRIEDIASSGSVANGAQNLLGCGAGCKGFSLTATPTFQYGGFFFRGDVSWVHASDYQPGSVFGSAGNKQNQARLAGEIGFIFGNNITEKP